MWYKYSFLMLVCSYMINATAIAEQQTYYTWTDADGIIQITATPPPSNADAQLHNVMEYETPEYLTPEQRRRRQLIQNMPPIQGDIEVLSNDIGLMHRSPKVLTSEEQLRESAKVDRARCREQVSDPNDTKQCINRVNYSLRLRLRLLKSKNVVPDTDGASSGYEETTQ